MYGLLLRALQDYVQANFAAGAWERIVTASGMPAAGFEPLLPYRLETLRNTLRHAVGVLERPAPVILEDLGTWVIAAAYNGAARRLLRFCGADFTDFLYSLGELPDRARLALPDLMLPRLSLEEPGPGLYRITSKDGLPELSWALLGALRAMADDYGALVLIEEETAAAGQGFALTVRLLASNFSEGRAFDLSRATADSNPRSPAAPVSAAHVGSEPLDALAALAGLSGSEDVAATPGPAPKMAMPPAVAPNAGDVTLTRAEFAQLMPLHLILSETGTILAAGPLIRRMFPGEVLAGTPLLQRFRARVSGQAGRHLLLPLAGGQRIRLQQRGGGGLRLRGVTVSLPRGEGVLMVFSFGIDIIRAVDTLKLTDSDFAATDMAIELLCLTEANGLAMAEMRALSRRLEGARRQAEDEALTDPLTGLRNRRAFDAVLTRLCSEGSAFTVMHLDLDHFKQVNDRHGHAAGDGVLINVASILSRLMRSGDCIARVGGDEFMVVIPGMEPSERIEQLAGQVIAQIAKPLIWREAVCRVSASIGIITVPRGVCPAPEEVVAEADKALYAAKAAGRGCAVSADFAAIPRDDRKLAPESGGALQALVSDGARLR